MAEDTFSSDGSLQSEDASSTFAQITGIVDTGKEPIPARCQSTTQNEPIQSQSDSTSRGLKRVKESKYITLFLDEKGRDVIKCNFCENVIHFGREMASCKKVTPKVCFTIPEEEEVEIPSRNVKARTVKGTTEGEGSCKEAVLLGDIDEQGLSKEGKELLEIAKQAIKELHKRVESDSREQMNKAC